MQRVSVEVLDVFVVSWDPRTVVGGGVSSPSMVECVFIEASSSSSAKGAKGLMSLLEVMEEVELELELSALFRWCQRGPCWRLEGFEVEVAVVELEFIVAISGGLVGVEGFLSHSFGALVVC